MIITRDPSRSGAAIDLFRGPAPPNAEVACDPGEVAVLWRDGRVLGVLGPGRGALSPGAVPFVQMALAPDGSLASWIYFVSVLPLRGIRFGGPLGAVQTAMGASVSPRVFGDATVVASDPSRLVQAVSAAPDADPSATLASYVSYAILEATRAIVTASSDIAGLAADGRGLASRVVGDANSRLGPVGLEIRELTSLTVASSDEDSRATGDAGEVAYEMLWDCKFCGTKKLLGLKHRYCPSCGAPQSAEDRYFPSDADKVRAEDHAYVGADVRCAHCGEANSKNSKHCEGCGAPLEGVADVARRQDQVVAEGAAYAGQTIQDARRERLGGQNAPKTPAKRSPAKIIASIGCLSVLMLVVLVVAAARWKKEAVLVVNGHSWKRQIAIEQFGPTADSSWCDSVPFAARSIHRTREVRSHRRIPDGQDCRMRKVDRGNGTFVERQECSPRYRDEPVYDDRCYYTIERWAVARTVDASGTSVNGVRWPDLGALRTGACLGCERPGAKKETYTVELTDPKGRTQTCDVDQNRWASLQDHSRWKGGIRVMGGGLDCSTLTPD